MKAITYFIFAFLFCSICVCSEVTLSESTETNSKKLSIGLMSSVIQTTNSSMPTINGIHFGYKFSNFDSYFEYAKGSYKNEPSLVPSAVGNEKEDQQSKYILALGIKGKVFNYLSWDLGFGVNQFSYSNEGVDLSCCVNIPYKYSYDFTGFFVRPSIGAEYSFKDWTAGIRLFSWMQYISKSVSNKVSDLNATINPYIQESFDSLDRDSIQSSHLIPPHLYLTYSF